MNEEGLPKRPGTQTWRVRGQGKKRLRNVLASAFQALGSHLVNPVGFRESDLQATGVPGGTPQLEGGPNSVFGSTLRHPNQHPETASGSEPHS